MSKSQKAAAAPTTPLKKLKSAYSSLLPLCLYLL